MQEQCFGEENTTLYQSREHSPPITRQAAVPNEWPATASSARRPCLPTGKMVLVLPLSSLPLRYRVMLAAALVLVLCALAGDHAKLMVETGSPFLQDYSWYSVKAAGGRLFPGVSPVNLSVQCLAVGPGPRSLLLDGDACASPDVTAASLTPTADAAIVVHVLAPTDDLLPWLWSSVLQAGDNDSAADLPVRVHSRSAGALTLEPLGIAALPDSRSRIRFEQLPYPLTAARAANVTNLLIVGEGFRHEFVHFLPRRARVGFISLASEDCNRNAVPRARARFDDDDDSRRRGELLDTRVRFGFLTYGDCSIVDFDTWRVWPLGPKTLSGFPARLNPARSPPMSQRSVDLNMMVRSLSSVCLGLMCGYG